MQGANAVDRTWSRGDRVVHAGRPEWGQGQVLSAEAVVIEGKSSQRLTVRFDRAGTKTVSTDFADLRAADDFPRVSEAAPDPKDALSSAADAATIQRVMTRLPEKATDPFLPLAGRIRATLEVYRAEESPARMLDWASVQTGLKDPLARFSRHELEQWFLRFRIEADNHLKKLVRDMRRTEPHAVDEVLASAQPLGKQALRRIDMGR